MSLRRVRVVVRKEVREFRRNRFVIGTMAVLPLVFLITPMITIFRIPESASGPQVKAAVGVISLLMLIIPIVLPPVIAAYSVVGERDQGTLEPVLTAPVRASELLLGKAVAVFIPSVGLAYALYFVVLLAVRFGAAHVVSSVLWHPPELLAQLLFIPLLALWSIWVGIGISTDRAMSASPNNSRPSPDCPCSPSPRSSPSRSSPPQSRSPSPARSACSRSTCSPGGSSPACSTPNVWSPATAPHPHIGTRLTGRSAAVAALAPPAPDAFVRRDSGDGERGAGICPPPASKRIREQAYEERDREVGAKLVLRGFRDRRGRAEPAADAALGECEQRHGRCREGGEADPDPARPRVMCAEQRSERLDEDVGDEQRVARRDELLGAALGSVRADPASAEQPDDHARSEHFDHAVDSEADQRHRAWRRSRPRLRSQTRPHARRCRPRRAVAPAVPVARARPAAGSAAAAEGAR